MRDEVRELERRAIVEIDAADGEKALEELRVRYLGKKGELTSFFKRMGELPKGDRPAFGAILNEVKEGIEERLARSRAAAEAKALSARLAEERVDITLPGRPIRLGRPHLLNQIMDQVLEIFTQIGFTVAEGPEIETDYYNFEALNIPADHPAREEHDTFYVAGGRVLRTHTSPVQIRVMESRKPPIRVVCPGAVFRNEALDATHSNMFHQIEGLMVDEGVTFGDLKGVLTLFCQRMFGEQRPVRFRASYFPFTEPSAEVDVQCFRCEGAGCRICKGTGWLEILGAGMVDPNVFSYVDYDAEKYTGFAFGVGVERIAMLKYGVDDVRLFLENDIRFLSQF